MLTELRVQGEIGRGSSIANVLRSDDEQVRLALLVQRELATNLSMIGAVLLARSGEELPDVDRNEVFDRSSWDDLTQSERDDAFMVECVDWSEQVVATADAASGIGGQLGPLVDELGAQAEELGDLCRQG